MYVAAKNFKSYKLGEFKKGQEVEYKKEWLDAGLIETKPEPVEKKETKPEPTKKKVSK